MWKAFVCMKSWWKKFLNKVGGESQKVKSLNYAESFILRDFKKSEKLKMFFKI